MPCFLRRRVLPGTAAPPCDPMYTSHIVAGVAGPAAPCTPNAHLMMHTWWPAANSQRLLVA